MIRVNCKNSADVFLDFFHDNKWRRSSACIIIFIQRDRDRGRKNVTRGYYRVATLTIIREVNRR